jgi:ABC-2 type transport system ATP-binding protein
VTSSPSVQLEQVRRRFGRTEVLHGISFEVAPGEVLGLLGPNGAGKTTTMRVLCGYLRPSAGRVAVGGVDIDDEPIAVRRQIGYLPESAPVPGELTVREYLRYCAKLRGVARRRRPGAVDTTVDKLRLGRAVDQMIGTLSKGFRQRVALAQALVHDPAVLVLDEPTASLDPRQVVETRELLARLGRRHTVLLSSHLLSEVRTLCRRVVIIDGGRVVATREVADLVRLSGGVRLDVRLSGDATRAARALSRLAGVTSAEPVGNGVVVRGSGPDLSERVSSAVVTGGFGLLELRRGDDALEEAYLRLVRG